jgi:hypothetical protein
MTGREATAAAERPLPPGILQWIREQVGNAPPASRELIADLRLIIWRPGAMPPGTGRETNSSTP